VQAFTLIPYPAENLPKIHIAGTIERTEDQLSICYEVSGQVDQIVLPAPVDQPSRKNDLWKATCFEFFLALPDQPQYWEFNMSPSSDWNVYVMDAYRQVNMREETSFTRLPFKFEKSANTLWLEIALDVCPIINSGQPLQAGITAIIQTAQRHESYWALAHPGPQADFHLRESFATFL
jgi:hypothetical protein